MMRKWLWAVVGLAGCTVQTAAAPPIVGSLEDRIAALEAKLGGTDGGSGGSVLSGVPAGTVVAFAGAVAPEGWVLCDGAALDGTKDEYKALFQTIGTTYGGDGMMFKVPDLQGRAAVGVGASMDQNEGNLTWKLGTVGGAATHQLTVDEMPRHTHDQMPHTHTDSGHQHPMLAQDPNSPDVGDCVAIYNPTFGSAHCSDYAHPALMEDGFANIQAATAVNAEAGSSRPYDTMPPYVVLNYIIKL